MSDDPAAEAPRLPGFWLYVAHLVTIWGLALSNHFLGLMILWSWFYRRKLRRSWADLEAVLLPLGLYAVTLVVSVAASLDPASSASGLMELTSLATLALGCVLVVGERAVRRTVDALLVMMVVVAVHGILQYLLTEYGDLHHRIIGPFSHYQTFAGVLLLGDLLLFARLITGDGWKKPSTWLAMVAVNWALLLTLTRGAWVGVALTVVGCLVIHVRRLLAAGLALIVTLGILLAVAAPNVVVERVRSIYDLRDPSNYDRLCMAQAGLYMIEERPLFGLGPEMVKERYPIYRHPTAPRLTVSHLHNAFLQLAAERGLLAVVAYFWVFGASLVLALRGYFREGGSRGPRADLFLGVILALVGFNVAGLFENNWEDTEVQRIVLFLLAVPLCLRTSEAAEDPD